MTVGNPTSQQHLICLALQAEQKTYLGQPPKDFKLQISQFCHQILKQLSEKTCLDRPS